MNTGDILDNNRPSSRMFDDLRSVHDKLVKLGLPMLLVTGNHDKTEPNWLLQLDKHENKGIILIDGLEWTVPGSDLTFAGVGSDDVVALREHLTAMAGRPGKENKVLVTHVLLRDFTYPDPTQIALDELPLGFRAIMLGDIHEPIKAVLSDGTPVCYPGSIERCNRSEPAEKGAWLWRVARQSSGKLDMPEWVPVSSRTFLALRIQDEDDMTKVLADLRTHAEEGPVVLCRYNKDLPSVNKRLQAAAGPKAIVRSAIISELAGVLNLGGQPDNEYGEKKSMLDFVPQFEPPGSDLHDVVMRLCTQMGTGSPELVIDEFIDNFMKDPIT